MDGEYINKYLALYELREGMKERTKTVNHEYKDMNDEIMEYMLANVPNQELRCNDKYSIKLKYRKRQATLNAKLITDVYNEFHKSHGRVVTEEETTAFLNAIKTVRKQQTETVSELHVVPN